MYVRTLVTTAALAAATAHAHIHVTINTAGNQTVIAVGFLDSEQDVTVENGYIYEDGTLEVFDCSNTFPSGPIQGWFGGDPLTLTSDFYSSTGNLDGGDFYFELAAVTPVNGQNDAVVAWAVDEDNTFTIYALSDADTREERSFHVGVGNHQHGQLTGLSDAGVYDVTLIAWDANGLYEDSEPVTFRITTSPLGECFPDLNADGNLNILDFVAYQLLFQNQDPGADCNGDGDFNILDFVCFQEAFQTGCGG